MIGFQTLHASSKIGEGDEQDPSSRDAVVRLTGLTKEFGSLRAVDHLNLEIRRGETVALLGPNGAGKTTTISMLLGLLAPDSGTATVLGMLPAEAIQHAHIGAMLQEGSLMPGVRVGELLDYVLVLSPSAMPRQRLIETARLGGLEKRRVDRLSGGQTQRVRFALAIASDPEVLVLDEPTAAMDVEARHEFWTSMHEYAATGRTVLFATHYLEEAEAFASRVVIIAAGRIVADGTVADLKKQGGMQTVRFTSAESDAHTLNALAGVRRVATFREQITLKTADADATTQALVASSIAWKDLEVHRASLEDVFMALVGNGTGNGAQSDNGGK